jgi:hypothetical protein
VGGPRHAAPAQLAIGDVEGHVDLEKQVGWLAGVLEARDFPLEHLAGNLELAADTVEADIEGAAALAGRLRDAAAHVREGGSTQRTSSASTGFLQ